MFVENRFNEVVKVCALERDLDLLPFGDATIVGERGSGLSGGQRARVSLARAVYRQADIYLLDDPLSAVDSRVGKHIFEQCVNGFLKVIFGSVLDVFILIKVFIFSQNKVCLLVTHQLQYIKEVEHIVLMNAGCIEAQGNLEEIRSSKNHKFVDNIKEDESQPEVEEERNSKINVPTSADHSKDQIQKTHKEHFSTGLQVFGVLNKYFHNVNSSLFVAFVAAMIVIAQSSNTFVSLYIAKW